MRNEAVFEFDQFPGDSGKVLVRTDGQRATEVVLQVDGQEHVILKADRDQWGVWITAGEVYVAQEDETRSFIDGLIRALQAFRDANEAWTKPATALTAATKHDAQGTGDGEVAL